MARPSPTSRSRQGPGTSWIVTEREEPGLPPWWFLLTTLGLGVGVTAVTIALGAIRGDLVHGERAFLDGGGAWTLAVQFLGYNTVRVLMGVIAAATVVGAGFIARRFTHSAGMGILAAVLVAMDPALLVDGQLAVPTALLRFAAVSSLALAMGGHPAYHWLVPIPVVVGAILEPLFLLWGAGLSVLLLFRGHIFAAPKHLRDAFLQGLGLPLLVAVPAWVAVDNLIETVGVVCAAEPQFWNRLLLIDVPHYGPGLVGIMNPVVSLGGLGVLVALVVGAVFQVMGVFRLARLPGRIQVRLPGRLGRTPSRALWLGMFALLMPLPEVAVLIGALAIVLGVQALMEDSPVFGTTVGLIVAGFAVTVVVRFILVIGGASSPAVLDAALQWVPWVGPYACSAPGP